MEVIELINVIGRESIAILTTIVLIVLLLKPKDKQLDEKNKQIETLLVTNSELADHSRTMVGNVSKLVDDVGSISKTMEKISEEMTVLSHNQRDLKNGQDELWREVVRLKGEK